MGTYTDPALILPGAVGQTELDASSKKDVVGGVAALDASGFLLAKGAGILFPRTGSNDVHIYERTSEEEAYAFHRAGADDYTFFIKESNVWKRFQTESMKDVVNGIAALDAGGHVLAPGYRFTAARGAAEQITIRERTSGERVFRWIRNGADDYEARVNVGGVEKVVQHAGLKNVANGIAGLDAGSKVSVANLPGNVCKIATDSYTCDSGTNKAIAHGLGVVPKFGFIIRSDGAHGFASSNGKWASNIGGSTNYTECTAFDSTNFYISGDLNYTGHTAIWVVFV